MGKIVVKKIQSQANNAPALTLPSTDGSANSVLQTDGNATLSWTDSGQGLGAATKSYSLPNTDGSANQALQVGTLSGTVYPTTFVTPDSNPWSVPGANEQGARLVDKYFFGLNDAANAASVTLTVPSSLTTDPDDVLLLHLVWQGTTRNQNNTSAILVSPVNQAGSLIQVSNGTYQGYKNFYYTTNDQGTYGTDQSNPQRLGAGRNNPYSGRTRFPGTAGTNNQYPTGNQQEWWFWNATGCPIMDMEGSYTDETGSGHNVGVMAGRYANWSTSQSFFDPSSSTANHALGLKCSFHSSSTMRDGVLCLYAHFRNGVVS